MDIHQKKYTVFDLAEAEFHDGNDGAWVKFKDGTLLIIRPEYQREFVYSVAMQVAVIMTLLKNFPIGEIYFSENKDGTLEVIDGQQRLLSILHFIAGDFSVEWEGDTLYWHNLPDELKERLLDYSRMTVYHCNGTETEKLGWFRTINIAGAVLNPQELLNATYHGPFVSSAREFFSKNGCRAIKVASMDGKPLIKGSPLRQDILETALEWAADAGL